VEYRLGYASGTCGRSPAAGHGRGTGAEHSLTLGYGVTSRIAPAVSLRLLQPTRGGGSAEATANVGARFPVDRSRELALAAHPRDRPFPRVRGIVRASAKAAASYDIDRLRVAANLHLERVFASDRDAVDVLVMAGASYKTLDMLRLGVEYVGQDLEGAFGDDEAKAVRATTSAETRRLRSPATSSSSWLAVRWASAPARSRCSDGWPMLMTF